MMAGLSYAHFTQYGYLRTLWLAIPWITATASSGIWPGLSLHQRWPDRDSGYWCAVEQENQNEYYYGVSRKESARSGLVAITRTTAGALTWS